MKTLCTAILALGALCLSAQTTIPGCLSDELRHAKHAAHTHAKEQHDDMENRLQQFIASGNAMRSASGYTIPVVVHIIHNNGPENIPNAQVLAGIQHMNEALANTGAFQDPDGVNTGIQLCHAQQDTNGNATTGINRVASALTNMTAETDDIAVKNLLRWNPENYLNIWIVGSITSLSVGPGVAGYAFMPSSHGNPEDGIVVEAAWFGSTTDNSKIVVHEVGHYLGLYHTFEGGGCANFPCGQTGDFVCDTPPDNSTAPANCFSPPNSCQTDENDPTANNPFRPVAMGGLGEQPDQIENYMDYGYQGCQTLFTAGQQTRMVAALATVRASLLQSPGCTPPCTSPITIGFNLSAAVITAGGTVNFTNTTTGAQSYEWFVGTQQIATTTNASHTFNIPGYYSVTLVAANSDTTCEQSLTQTVHVECGAQASFTVSPAGPYAVGATLTFTKTSTNATAYEWVLDGISQGTSANYGNTFGTAGGHYAYLVSGNGQCSDTSASFFFRIGSCGQAGMIEHWFMPEVSLHFSGLNFPTVGTSPLPAVLQGGGECSSSASDANGNLRFFTDGVTVWDRNHQPMPNGMGLMGNYSSTQTCIVVPEPGNADRYYVFTTPCYEQNFANGFRYSIVDMTLNGGLGDVVTAQKNIFIRGLIGEKVTATYHANGTDTWVATASNDGDSIFAYLLTAAGLNMTPVVTAFPIMAFDGFGDIKFSHDGNRLVLCVNQFNFTGDHIRIFDFNSSTGQCSNMIQASPGARPYGVEFSPDNSKLYVGLLWGNRLVQYDLAAGGPSAIIASATTVGVSNQSYAHVLLGPDGRIYAVRNQTHLDYIQDPDQPGTACNFQQDAVFLPNVIGWCLPNHLQGIQRFGPPRISGPRRLCGNQQQYYELAFTTPADSTIWTHSGDGVLLSYNDTSAILQVGGAGVDTLIVKCFGACGVMLDTFIAETVPPQPIDLGPDTFYCGGWILDPGPGYLSYLWHDLWDEQFYYVNGPGAHYVTVVDSNHCVLRDTINIAQSSWWLPPIDLGPDITTCLGGSVLLNAWNSSNYASYTWQDGSHNTTFTAYQPGTYWLTISDGCTTSTDTINVIAEEPAIPLDLGADTMVCANGYPFTISAPAGYGYLWHDNSTAATYNVAGPGVFWVDVTDSSGCYARDTIEVQLCTGTADLTATGWQVYPNPAADRLTVVFGSGASAVQLELFDPAGRLVLRETPAGMISVYELNISGLTGGIYLLQVKAGEEMIRQKVVIRHE